MPQSKKEMDYRYNHSLKGFIRRKRYNNSETGRACRERYYAKHGGQPAYTKEHYHKLQDEAGCHMETRNFRQGFRLIEALATAEVVEI